ncbi:MAG: xylene monooxygenase [Nanoarchaeota archaeon]|nr:xylene monooxygenase [Nanoarchaeota archaeon]
MNFIGKITNIKQETPDVKIFRFTKPEDFTFIPGQYCLVSLDKKEFLNESRPFTFSSSPLKEYIELTIKEMGDFTKELFKLQINDEVKIDGPKGETLNFNDKEDIVFLAAGSGITPFISIMRYVLKKNLSNKITLLFSNKSEQDIIYKEELENLKEKFTIINTLTNDIPPNWKDETGRINKSMISKYVKDFKNTFYICGPPTFTHSMLSILKELNVQKIKFEEWELPGKNS